MWSTLMGQKHVRPTMTWLQMVGDGLCFRDALICPCLFWCTMDILQVWLWYPSANFWAGLTHLHCMTVGYGVELQVHMDTFENEQFYAQYASCSVSNSHTGFRLNVSEYSGTPTNRNKLRQLLFLSFWILCLEIPRDVLYKVVLLTALVIYAQDPFFPLIWAKSLCSTRVILSTMHLFYKGVTVLKALKEDDNSGQILEARVYRG